MYEKIASYKPGDKLNVTYVRNGKEFSTSLTLKNKVGTTNLVKNESAIEKLGGELVNVDKATAQKNNIAGGVLVKKVGNGALKSTRMQDGFVITDVNGQEIKNLDDLKEALKSVNGGQVRLGGIYPGYEGTYAYPLVLDGSNGDGQGDDGSNGNN